MMSPAKFGYFFPVNRYASHVFEMYCVRRDYSVSCLEKKTAKSYSMRSHSIFSPYPPSIRRTHLPARLRPLSVGGGEQAILRIGGAGQDSKQSG
jgi:hypothetical protein